MDMNSLVMQARDKASLPWYNVMGDCREVVRQWEKMYRSVHPVAAVPHPSAMRGWRGGMAEEAAHIKKRGGGVGLDRQVGARGSQHFSLLSPKDAGDFCRLSAPSLAQTGGFSVQADRLLPLLLG